MDLKQKKRVNVERVTHTRNLKNRNGITVIALIVTIIVLMILAGVIIVTLTGENGLLARAATAREKNNEATIDEKEKLANYENIIDETVSGDRGTVTIDETTYAQIQAQLATITQMQEQLTTLTNKVTTLENDISTNNIKTYTCENGASFEDIELKAGAGYICILTYANNGAMAGPNHKPVIYFISANATSRSPYVKTCELLMSGTANDNFTLSISAISGSQNSKLSITNPWQDWWYCTMIRIK